MPKVTAAQSDDVDLLNKPISPSPKQSHDICLGRINRPGYQGLLKRALGRYVEGEVGGGIGCLSLADQKNINGLSGRVRMQNQRKIGMMVAIAKVSLAAFMENSLALVR